MRRTVSSLLVATMLAVSAPSWADPPLAVPVVSPLTKGQPAPFAGVLLSPEAVAQIVAQQDTAAATQKLAVQHQADLDGAQLKFQLDQFTTTCTADKSVMQAQIDDQKTQLQVINDQLKKSSSGPPASVWIGVGAASGVVLTVLTVFAVSRATK